MRPTAHVIRRSPTLSTGTRVLITTVATAHPRAPEGQPRLGPTRPPSGGCQPLSGAPRSPGAGRHSGAASRHTRALAPWLHLRARASRSAGESTALLEILAYEGGFFLPHPLARACTPEMLFRTCPAPESHAEGRPQCADQEPSLPSRWCKALGRRSGHPHGTARPRDLTGGGVNMRGWRILSGHPLEWRHRCGVVLC